MICLKFRTIKFIKIIVLLNVCDYVFGDNKTNETFDFSNVMHLSTRAFNTSANLNHLLGDEKEADNRSDSAYLSSGLEIVFNAISQLNETECSRDAFIVIEAIEKREKWALKMFDASSKFPTGILFGNRFQLGSFDECVSISHESPNRTIFGEYCLADIELFSTNNEGRSSRSSESLHQERGRNMFNNTISWGVCVPATCGTSDVITIIQDILHNIVGKDYQRFDVRLTADKCHTNEKKPWKTIEIIYLYVLCGTVAFILFASVFHYYCIMRKKSTLVYNMETRDASEKGNVVMEIIQCFSLIKTVGKLLHVKKTTSSAHLNCICGIRFLSMSFIIAGHSLLFMIGGPILNTDFYEKESVRLQNAIFTNSPLLVDTFLLFSGFLMCYLLLQEFDKRNGRINFLILYIGRYIRLTPSYAIIIGLYASVLTRIGSGPLWDSRIGIEQERCVQSWWTNLLYVNNYVNTDSLCMFQSWYLAVDYHLFIIAPFLIYPLWKWGLFGKIWLTILTTISIFVPFWITYSNKLDPTLMAYAPEVYDLNHNYYFKNAYIKTHMRASSYFIGLFIGYFAYKLQIEGVKMKKIVIVFGWILSAVCGIVSMFSIVIFFDSKHVYNALEAAIYACLHRVAWCVSIGWILIVCISDNATFVNRFLSWKPFIPLSRLTYCAYLINGFVEVYSFGLIRTGTAMNTYELATRAVSHILITFSLAFIVCILFESPIHELEKILLRKENSRQKSRPPTNGVGNTSTGNNSTCN